MPLIYQPDPEPVADPTREQLAASIGCAPEQIIRSELHQIKTRMSSRGQVWTSFVDEGDPEHAAVYETQWPQ